MKTAHRIDCRKCRHYFVSWEPARPHGCRIMGFKSLSWPSQVVYRSSGATCNAFRVKALKKRNARRAPGK